MMLTKRCNLADTLPGTILINGFIHQVLDAAPDSWYWTLFPLRFILEAIDVTSAVTGFTESAYSFEILFERLDYFNAFRILAKVIKFLVQLYMKGVFSQK